MAVTLEKATLVPARLLAALHRTGMPASEIAHVYNLQSEVVVAALEMPPELLSIDDMELLRDDDHRYELWEGELWRMSPTKKRHGRGTSRITTHLVRYLDVNPLGSLYLGEVGYRAGARQTLSCLDVAYVSNERDAPVGDDEFFPYAPDLAIEVLSPDNTRPKVWRKARAYLANGARLVWAIDSRRRAVTVFRPGAEPQVLRGDEVLSGEDVLPGLAIRVADLF